MCDNKMQALIISRDKLTLFLPRPRSPHISQQPTNIGRRNATFIFSTRELSFRDLVGRGIYSRLHFPSASAVSFLWHNKPEIEAATESHGRVPAPLCLRVLRDEGSGTSARRPPQHSRRRAFAADSLPNVNPTSTAVPPARRPGRPVRARPQPLLHGHRMRAMPRRGSVLLRSELRVRRLFTRGTAAVHGADHAGFAVPAAGAPRRPADSREVARGRWGPR